MNFSMTIFALSITLFFVFCTIPRPAESAPSKIKRWTFNSWRLQGTRRGSHIPLQLKSDSPGVQRRDSSAEHDQLDLLDHFFWALRTLPRTNPQQQQQLDGQR